jgi:hypothetical protein
MEELLLDYLKSCDEYSFYDDIKIEYLGIEGTVCIVNVDVIDTDRREKTYVNIWEVLVFVNQKIK